MTLLVASAIKASLVMAAALIASRAARTAAVRHAMLAAAIGCAGTLPLLSFIVPHWSAAALLGSDAGLVAAGWLHPIAPWVLAAWASGTLLGLVVVAMRLVRLASVTARCERIADGALADLVLDVSAEYRLQRPVTLLESETGSLLGTWGIDPRIIVPRQAQGWNADTLAIVVRHELAHVRRHDWLVQTTTEAVRALYWFNPLMWVACRRLREESEHACDAEVLASGIDVREYAARLVDLARSLRPQGMRWPAAAMTSALDRRVRAILRSQPLRTPAPRRARTAIVVTMASVTLLLAAIGRPSGPRTIAIPSPRAHKLTLMLDGQIVDLSHGWPPAPDPNAGLVPGRGFALVVRTNR